MLTQFRRGITLSESITNLTSNESGSIESGLTVNKPQFHTHCEHVGESVTGCSDLAQTGQQSPVREDGQFLSDWTGLSEVRNLSSRSATHQRSSESGSSSTTSERRWTARAFGE